MLADRPFEFATAGRIVCGAGRAATELAPIVADLGTRPMVCTGADPDRYAGLIAPLRPCAVVRVGGEPTVDVVRAAVATARAHGADVLVAIGGGSPIDVAKAVAAVLANGGDPLDYLPLAGAARALTTPAIPCVTVPTTAGTGAEVTANAVLAVPRRRIKVSLRSPLLLPRVALVDPVLGLTAPPATTASSGLDALTQCLEAYVSVAANPVTDALATEGLRRAASGLRRAHADGGDLAARTDLAMCALLSGMALANARLGAVHGFAGVIGGLVAVPHGFACAALLVPVVEANVRAGAVPDRYREVARLLTGRPDATAADGIGWLRETVDLLRVPRLDRYGLRPEHHAEVVANTAKASSTKGNPVVLAENELHEILNRATGQ